MFFTIVLKCSLTLFSDSSIFSFLQNDVEKAFECIFVYDYLNRKVSAYTPEDAVHATDIYLSFDNLLKKVINRYKKRLKTISQIPKIKIIKTSKICIRFLADWVIFTSRIVSVKQKHRKIKYKYYLEWSAYRLPHLRRSWKPHRLPITFLWL